MTEPRSGPANQGGQPGGYGPPADPGQGNIGSGDMGRGTRGASSAGEPGQGNIGSGDMGRGTRGASSAGGPGQETSGSGYPDEGTRQARGAGTSGESAEAQGGVKTRTSQAQATVPQQYGPQAERPIEGEAAGMRGFGDRGPMIAAAAGKAWPELVLCALGLLAVGIMLLVWPAAALTLVAVLNGAAVLLAGIVKLAEAFTASNHSAGTRAAYIVIGLFAVLAGSYLLVHHALSLFLLAFVTGLFFIVHGVADIGAAIHGDVPGRGLRAVLGVFSIAAGIVMLVWPAITLVLLLTIVAAWLLLYGLVLGGLAYSLRKAAKEGGAGEAKHAPAFKRRKLAASAR
jgi:uncharacterized membrane protein HdeD (DUF308 family)